MKPTTLLATATDAKTGSTTTAVIDGVTTTIQVARDLTVAAGDLLLVHRVGAQWFASSRHYASAVGEVDNDVAPDPQPATYAGILVVAPVDTGSYRSSGWRSDTDVRQGEYGGSGNHTGAVFYGGKPRSLAGATVVAASIAVRREVSPSFGATATTMRLVTEATRPSGAPTLTDSTTGPSLAVRETDAAFAIPTGWAQDIVDGNAGGIGFYDADGSPYVVFAGRGSWSPAFTLTINWQRS